MPQPSPGLTEQMDLLAIIVGPTEENHRRTISPLNIMTVVADMFGQFIFNQMLDSMVEFIKGLRN